MININRIVKKNKQSFIFVVSILFLKAIIVMADEPEYIEISGTLPGYPDIAISSFRGYEKEYCIKCHRGIEEISNSHPLSWGCTICHLGNPDNVEKDEAHRNLLHSSNSLSSRRNPSNLRIVEFSCGQKFCHGGHKDSRLNHIERVKKSQMSQQKGILSNIKYIFGEPFIEGSMEKYLENDKEPHLSFIDGKWKRKCVTCHLWDEGRQSFAQYRSQGCTACHMLYDEDGLYKGNDPTIKKDIPGYPKKHKLTVSVPSRQCNICHKNSPTSISGITYNSEPQLEDLHASAGLECIDCHTIEDVMGDGKSYNNGMEQVEIRCWSCHGRYDKSVKTENIKDYKDPVIRLSKFYGKERNRVGDEMLLTERGNKFSNVKVQNGEVVLRSKISGRQYIIPQITNRKGAHSDINHDRLECSSCHFLWVPQYYGGKDIVDISPSYDNQENKFNRSNNITGKWFSSFEYKRIFNPSFGINSRDKVSVFIPSNQMRFTAIDKKGNLLTALDLEGKFAGYYDDFIFTTLDGYSSALSSRAVNPHSVSKEVVNCEGCHLNTKSLGFGEGRIVTRRTLNKGVIKNTYVSKGGSAFSYDALITLKAQQVAATGNGGERGFNKNELFRILKVGMCITCHDKYNDPIYFDIESSYKVAKERKHNKIIKGFLP